MPGHADQYFSDRNFRILDLLKEKEAELGIPSIPARDGVGDDPPGRNRRAHRRAQRRAHR